MVHSSRISNQPVVLMDGVKVERPLQKHSILTPSSNVKLSSKMLANMLNQRIIIQSGKLQTVEEAFL